MNPMYGGPNISGPGPVISYSQPSQQRSFNGYESSNTAGYGQMSQPPSNKPYPPGPYLPVNPSQPSVQNGPAMRSGNPYVGETTPYNQNISSQAPPPLVPTSSYMNPPTEQLSQQFGDMNIIQNKGPSYLPTSGASSFPTGTSSFPTSGTSSFPTSGTSSFPRPPGPNGEMPRPPDASKPPFQQMSFTGLPPTGTQYRPPSNPLIQQQQLSNYPSQESSLGRNANSFPNESAKFPVSAQMPPGPLPPHAAPPPNMGAFHTSRPPVSGNQQIMANSGPSNISNGMYYPEQQIPPNVVGPPIYNSQTNGPGMPPAMPQYTSQMQPQQPPMQYPPASQQASSGPGMLPPQQQYPPSGMGAAPKMSVAPPAPAAQRRLDPDSMPSPIQVIEDDKKQNSGTFVTNTKGKVPPLVTTDFVVNDTGMCSPRFMRSTIYTVPTTADILKQTFVPFSLVLSPFAELQEGEISPPISDFGEIGPVRCNRCKAYMCPFMQFIDGGRRFQCVFCKATTEVPPEFFSHLDHTGERMDKYQRAELCLGSYELIATKEYCKNTVFPNDPAFIFIIDVSYNSVRNGLLNILCQNLKSVLANVPKEIEGEPPKIKVGFITYSNVVHFYNVKGGLMQPQMMAVPDVGDMFMPLLDGFLVDVTTAENVIDNLLLQLTKIFAETKDTETVLGPAIQAGLEALKAANCSGKLFVFHTTLPFSEAPGKLKNRDDRKLLGTDKEKTVLTPQSPFYNNLGQECVAAGCCVDLFLFPNAYIDVATIGQVCRLSGGQLYKYTYFQADIDGARFLEDLKRDVAKPIAFDAVIRIRTSTGIRPTDFWGNFFMSNTTDIEVGAIDCDKAIAIEIKYDDKLSEEDSAYIQAAILFTSCSGQRRLRVHNLALNTSSQMSELFRNCELDTIMNVFSKEAVRMISEQTPHQVKDHFISRSAQILACYRKNCATRSSVGQLILPECMKLLPLYINCLIKSEAIAGGQEISIDERSYIMLALNSMDVQSSAGYLYPRMLTLHDLSLETAEVPVAMRCSIERVKENGVYVVENGLSLIIWIGLKIDTKWLEDVFGVPVVSRIDIDKVKLSNLNTAMSERVCNLIAAIQQKRQRHMKVIIARQGDKHELLFRQLLVEDRTTDNSSSYVDFLCHLHKEIRSLLS